MESKEEDFLAQAQREVLKDSRKRDKKTAFPTNIERR